ncbi:hypothetical protein B0H16DRAFT_1480158 [Mycena metata]|uniref:Uncharacterized protein n=1 Tax=Mycena metata TaxID=1033252 RepID=A0AAD7H4J1_9AGAR|nr:hypothetical protein B0H16DRAFT_1480158 [Mycena metata]
MSLYIAKTSVKRDYTGFEETLHGRTFNQGDNIFAETGHHGQIVDRSRTRFSVIANTPCRESRPSPKMPPQHRPALRPLEASPTPNIMTSSSRIVGPTLWLTLKSRNEEELRVKARERMRRMRERAREDPTKLKEQAAQKKKHDEAYRASPLTLCPDTKNPSASSSNYGDSTSTGWNIASTDLLPRLETTNLSADGVQRIGGLLLCPPTYAKSKKQKPS